MYRACLNNSSGEGEKACACPNVMGESGEIIGT